MEEKRRKSYVGSSDEGRGRNEEAMENNTDP